MSKEPEIIYEDLDIVAINKPPDFLVHSTPQGKNNGEKTLSAWLLRRYPEIVSVGDSPTRPGMVHRLDKDTSGVMVITKNQETFDYLKSQFKNRVVDKTYRAIVFGVPKNDAGVIKGTISIKPGTTKRTVYKGKMPKEAVTEYKVLERFENAALLEVHPKTGRTHQVRIHLASINHPVFGDPLYSSKTSKKIFIPQLERQMLHAYEIELETRKGRKIRIKADEQEDFLSVLQYLRKTPKLD